MGDTEVLAYPEMIRIKASVENKEKELNNIPVEQEEIRLIIDAMHQAYINANRMF